MSNNLKSQGKSDISTVGQSEQSSLPTSADSPVVPANGDLKTLAVVLAGYGGAGHQGGYLTDALQILIVNFEKRELALISIPRDLWVKLPDGRMAKINSAYAPGGKNLKNVLSDITGLTINYLVAVDFVGFQRLIGINLKGIDVQVGQTFEDPWYPISGEELNTCGMDEEKVAQISRDYKGVELEKQFSCRYEKLHFEQGTVHMEGGEALKYVRSRHGSAEGDVSRGRRAQEILQAIAKKLFSLNAFDDIPGIYEDIVKNVSTDLDLESAKYLGPLLKTFLGIKVKNINLATTNVLTATSSDSGQSILIPKEGVNKWDKIRSFIKGELEKD